MTTTAPAPAVPAVDVPAPSLPTLVAVELRKATDTRAGAWLLVGIVALALAVPALILFFGEAPEKTFTEYLGAAHLPVAVLLPVVGILLVTGEWSQRTALTTFALVPQRSRVLVAKMGAAVLLAVLGVLAGVAAAALAAALTPVLTDDPTSWSLGADQVVQVLLVQVLNVLVGRRVRPAPAQLAAGDRPLLRPADGVHRAGDHGGGAGLGA
ncbi:hypothetical protein [Blastococcus sp. SYSU DS1024]